MTYKECVTRQCEEYAKNSNARFIGYNTVYGSRMYGTLDGVATSQCIEAPVAENLMVGLAMGMALEGYRPVVCFERHDFLLLALDAMVNQMDKMPWMSGGQFKWPIIIRAIVGGSEPIDPGPMHKQDYSIPLQYMLRHTPVITPRTVVGFSDAWNYAGKSESGAIVIIERKDTYNKEIN
jgi:pyruvate dehydrogenase E1 component beta subunit